MAYKAQTQRWVGATAGTKAAIAALVAGQGAISTATKAVVAASTTLRDGFLVGTLYNAWNPYKTASLVLTLK
jgi:hypothetical protein